jgi:K+-transporting ATPase KdpF subunit
LAVNALYACSGLLTVALLGYLLYALLRPEDF